jgi:hypothetical protein
VILSSRARLQPCKKQATLKGCPTKDKTETNIMAEKDKRCQFLIEGFTSCGREIYDYKYCIFHSGKTDKDAKLFQKQLNEIFEDISLEIYDFSGFVFPIGISFPTEIDKQVIFKDATFQSLPLLYGSTFQEWVDFRDATFKADANFTHATFEKGVSFLRTTFKDDLVIDEEVNKQIFSKKEVDFRYVRFVKPEKVIFRKVDLSKFRFLGTDLRKVEFVDVDRGRKRGRNKIYDEIEAEPETKKFDYPLIAQVYKRLRANYEENLNYAEAGDFHIGEMECKRKSSKTWFGKNLSLTAWYKYVSNYGESYRRPLLFWILPILIFFPIFFMYFGIEGITHSQTPYLINYDFDVSSTLRDGEKVDDYLKSFVYSLSVFSLVREKQYRPINNWGHFWMVLESILSPVLIAFFLLALRRRFRR